MAFDLKYYGGILATTGTPASTVGQSGDYALDLTTTGGPFIYLKTAGVWSSATGLKGSPGSAGNLWTPSTKTAAYTVTSTDVTASGIPLLLANAATANVPITIDAATLWNATTGQSYAVEIKRIDSSATYGVTIVAGGTSETVDGYTSVSMPVSSARRIMATSATTLIIS